MSLLNFEDRKIFLKNNYNNKNQKKTYNKNMRKNNQKKIFLGINQETHSSSNSSSQNKILSPTLRNAMKSKNKNMVGNDNKNLKGIDQFNLIQKLNKNQKEENNYKHNKSFEENAINNNILLQYKIESPLVPGNMDNCGNEILEILNLNNNTKTKNMSKKKLNNSYILQSKFKSMINDNNKMQYTHNKNNNYSNNIYNNNIYKNNIYKNKLDDDIDHNELIIGSNHKNEDKDEKHKNESNLDEENNNLVDLNIDEYLLDSSFENNKNDFNLLYSDNYHKNVKNDMLTMEMQLLCEKILELQKSYHNKEKMLYMDYFNEKRKLKLIHENKILLKKKIINLLNLKEKKNMKENNSVCIGFNIKKNIYKTSYKINKNEINLLNRMFPLKEIMNEKGNKKIILKQIFKNVVYDRYKLVNSKLNEIEKNIVNSLIKKYKFNENNDKSNSINNNSNKTKKRNVYNRNNKLPTTINKSTNHSNKVNQNKIRKKSGPVSRVNFNKNYNGSNTYRLPIRSKIN